MKKLTLFCLFSILILGLTGCITPAPGPRSQFYQLQPVAAGEPVVSGTSDGPVVRIGPVQVSEYLNRPQLVTRVGDHQVAYDELHRWAEPLQDNILWVLTKNLSEQIPEARVLPFTAMPTVVDTGVTVPVRISRLESDPDGTVLLQAGWMVISRESPKSATPERITLSKMATSTSTEDLVAAQSALIQELSEKIVAEIRAVLKETP
jgi:uncharacterized protein